MLINHQKLFRKAKTIGATKLKQVNNNYKLSMLVSGKCTVLMSLCLKRCWKIGNKWCVIKQTFIDIVGTVIS